MRPLWEALLEHHSQLEPQVRPPRSAEDSWRRRRAEYLKWLAEPGSFVVVTEGEGGEPAGYAVVRVGEGDDTWVTGDRTAELETLAVASGRRGEGIGGLLMDAVDAELAALGIVDLKVGVVSSNVDAMRFYERRGLVAYQTVLYRRRG